MIAADVCYTREIAPGKAVELEMKSFETDNHL
jgi:hypothetical protein